MFYTFRQNNSGGSFIYDKSRGISVSVIVEANNLEDAKWRANSIGLYFDGVEDGSDCSCCGDRWYEPWSDDADKVPCVYGVPVEEATVDLKWIDGYETFVHNLDGSVVGYHA